MSSDLITGQLFENALICSGRGTQKVLATGVDLKHSLCLLQGNTIQLSPLLGDLNHPELFTKVSVFLDSLTDVDMVACDLHPDLHSTLLASKLAERLNIPLVHLQHHHAHIAAVMAEFGLEQPVIGLAMDGYGYGTDGSAWGGECLFVHGAEMKRVGHLKSVAMPGGDAASREPWRMAVSWLDDIALSMQLFPGQPVEAVSRLCKSALTTTTSSAGRLFDAASAIILGHTHAAFEGEAAIRLEEQAKDRQDTLLLPYGIKAGVIDMSSVLHELAKRRLAGENVSVLAASFHTTLAKAFAELAKAKAIENSVKDMVLAGGCFLNQILEQRISNELEESGFKVWQSVQVARGDGGVALGQAWLAAVSSR